MLAKRFGGPYNRRMMNVTEQNGKPVFIPEERVGLSFEKYDELSLDGKAIYNMLYDYCTYSSDPQYKTLHKYRVKISKLEGRDRELLIEYFNHDPAINWNGISAEPWTYYEKPY